MSRCASTTLVSLRSLFPKAQILGASDIRCDSCHSHPETVKPNGVLFIGLEDTEDLARQVIEGVANGAVGIVTEQFLPSPIPQCIVSDVREAYAVLANAIVGNPSKKVLTIGVIGTHGKTTAALITAAMLKHVGNRVAYHSTLGGCDGATAGLRSDPDSTAGELASFISKAQLNGSPAVVLEITDEMLCTRATQGIEFDVLLFTSLRKSQRVDKLRARGVENSLQRLMGQLKNHGVIVYNADDARLNRWIQRHQPHSIGYGIDAACDVMGKRLKTQGSSQSMMVQVGRSVMPLTSRLIGDHNARHILGAVAIGYAFGLDTDEIVAGIERLQRIPGRLQSIANPRCSVTIDLADQADRLAVSLHALARNNSAPIVCVAEVPESATAEQLMAYGRVLERAASRVILTQSRVSAANAQKTIWNVLDGCSHPAAVQIVPNRETAIEFALRSARPGDQIMLAGWGSVRWTNNQTRESKSDLDVVEALLAKLECERHQSAPSAATNDESSPVARHSLRIFGPA